MQMLQIKFVTRKRKKFHYSISKEELVEWRRPMKEELKWVDSFRAIRVDSKCLTCCHLLPLTTSCSVIDMIVLSCSVRILNAWIQVFHQRSYVIFHMQRTVTGCGYWQTWARNRKKGKYWGFFDPSFTMKRTSNLCSDFFPFRVALSSVYYP